MECRAWKPFTRSSTLPLACASGQGMWAAAAIQEVSATTPSSAAAPVSSPFAQQASLARFSSPQQQHHHQRQQDSSTASAGAVPPPEDGGTRLHSPPQGDSGAPHTSERDTVTAVQQEAPAAAAPAAAASSGGARGQQGEPRLAHEQDGSNGGPSGQNGQAGSHDSAGSTPGAEEALQQQLLVLQQQLKDARGNLAARERQLRDVTAPVTVSPRPPNAAALTPQDWEKLQLRLLKAERALQHERTHAEALTQQLDAQRAAAAVGERASSTIQALQAELGRARALAEQRTCEAAALQRALQLSDETGARLRQQLAGLLQSNQVAMAREQDMERQVQELRHQLENQKHQAAQALAMAQAAAQQGPPGYRALQEQAAKLQQENAALHRHLAQQEAALAEARAECGRKDAGIKALEGVLARHGTPHASAALASPAASLQPPSAHHHHHAPPATVAIDIVLGPGAAATGAPASAAEEPVAALVGGLTDSQWKLVMLSEEVRSLRAKVHRVRQHGPAAAAVAAAAADDSGAQQAEQQQHAPGAAPDSPMHEVVEVDLPADEVRARVALLARQMQQLEEELQELLTGGKAPGRAGGGEGAADGGAQGNGHVSSGSVAAEAAAAAPDLSGAGRHQQHGAGAEAQAQPPYQHHPGAPPTPQTMQHHPQERATVTHGGKAGASAVVRKARRGWWGWFLRSGQEQGLGKDFV